MKKHSTAFFCITCIFFISLVTAVSLNAMDPAAKSTHIPLEQCSITAQESVLPAIHTTIMAHLNITQAGQTLPDVGQIAFSYSHRTKQGQISHIGVSSDYRNRGLGAHLLTYACTKLHELGCTKISLFAAPPQRENLPLLIAFYNKHGFVLDAPFDGDLECFGCHMHKNLYPAGYEDQIASLYKELPNIS